MINSKLTELIKALPSSTIKKFNNYIQNHFSQQHTQVYQLWSLLRTAYPNFDPTKTDKNKIYTKVFKDINYNENRLAKIMTELFVILEDFIVFQQVKEDKIRRNLHLMNFYQKNQLDRIFYPTLKETEKLLVQEKESGRKYASYYEIEILKLMIEQTYEHRNLEFQDVYDALQTFAMGEAIRWINLEETGSRNQLILPNPNNLFYNIHYRLASLKDNLNHQSISETYNYLQDFLQYVEEEESREIINIFLSHAIRWVNQSNGSYQILIDIYDLAIRQHIFIHNNNTIFLATYKNYITCCLKMKQIEQAAHFLETYKNFLPKEVRDDAYHFNKAQILFEKGAFDQVQTILNTIKSTDIFYKINQRRLFIKTFYELLQQDGKYFDIYQSYCVAFKKFIYTDEKIPEYLRDANKSFLKILQKIENLDTQSTTKQHKILKELNETPSVAERDWLKDKIAFRMEEE
ncbi:MAG: hypothetical protein K1X55_11080 [Chitinophagales bacterium]|nr:hypothetical protein [Chitinophagales bacterium]